MAEYKNDIFQVLKALDEKNEQFFSSLSEEQMKEIQPFLLARWLTGINKKQSVFLINEITNQYLFSLSKHKLLLLQLLMVCTSGQPQRYKWTKQLSQRKSVSPNSVKVIKEYFNYSTKDAERYVKCLKPEEILLMAEDLGWQDSDIKLIKKELTPSKK